MCPCAQLCVQVLYLDADTLWLESMASMRTTFKEFTKKQALFGLVVETTHMMADINYYKTQQGRSLNFH